MPISVRKKHMSSPINQAALIHDILSLRRDFEITSPVNHPLGDDGEFVCWGALKYDWFPIQKVTGNGALIASWNGQLWEGVSAA